MPLYSNSSPLPINRKIFRHDAPAPSGIPVATTNTINVVDTFGYNGTITLTKINSTLYAVTPSPSFIYGSTYCEVYSDYVNIYTAQVRLTKEGNDWIYRYEGVYNCDENYSQNSDLAYVLEVTSGIIPTTGWSNSLTITAA